MTATKLLALCTINLKCQTWGGKTYLHQLGTMDQDVWCLTSLSAIFQLEQGAIMAVIVW